MDKITYYTEKGFQRLRGELHKLKTKGRATVAEQLTEARSKGDLSENAEYDAAKDAQALLEMKIHQMENTIAHARIISEEDIDTSQVAILTKVRIRHTKQNKVLTYTIVAEEEADVTTGKISVESPIGKGLLGKNVGETAMIDAPVGQLAFEILDITSAYA